jgi:hypothetical protein
MNQSISKYSHISDPQKITKILVMTFPQLSKAFSMPPGPQYMTLMVVNPELNKIRSSQGMNKQISWQLAWRHLAKPLKKPQPQKLVIS